MKVLMLGWEFPPYFAGGVGVVCEALSRALAARGAKITFVMPSGPSAARAPHLLLLVASQHAGAGVERTIRIDSLLGPYQGEADYAWQRWSAGGDAAAPARTLYGRDLLAEVQRFASQLLGLVDDLDLDFDVIHAHDWTTFPAAVALKARTGKPLVVHVHITEFDKSGGAHADPGIYAIERAGMHGADAVVAVSRLVKDRCVGRYGVAPDRVEVVYNAVDREPAFAAPRAPVKRGKVVLFLGRVTLQKGPDHFVEAARRVLDHDPQVTFVLAGAGDMLPRLVERSAELGLGSKMVFTGFVDRSEADRLYGIADVFVMPSVSEPFGLVALEAIDRGVPVILSRQSGASEVVRHGLKVDFWHVEDLADKMLAALRYPSLRHEITRNAARELDGLTWAGAAGSIQDIYGRLSADLLPAEVA